MINNLIEKYKKWKEKRKAIKTYETLKKYIDQHFIDNKGIYKKLFLGDTDE